MSSFRSCFNSYLKMLWRYGLIIVFCLIATFLLAHCDDYTKASSNVAWCLPDLVALFTATIAALNALLLYKTLMSQNVNFERQKYESTFFNLLNSHQKITSELHAQDQTINASLDSYFVPINGHHFFTFAMLEIGYIYKSLSSHDFQGHFDENNDKNLNYNRHLYQEELNNSDYTQDAETKDKQNYEDCLVKLANKKYQISKEEWNQKHQSDAKDIESYMVFERRWVGFYEHYLKSIGQLLAFTQKQGQTDGLNKDAEYYSNFIAATMTHDEVRFIKLYCKCHENENKALIELINKTNDQTIKQ